MVAACKRKHQQLTTNPKTKSDKSLCPRIQNPNWARELMPTQVLQRDPSHSPSAKVRPTHPKSRAKRTNPGPTKPPTHHTVTDTFAAFHVVSHMLRGRRAGHTVLTDSDPAPSPHTRPKAFNFHPKESKKAAWRGPRTRQRWKSQFDPEPARSPRPVMTSERVFETAVLHPAQRALQGPACLKGGHRPPEHSVLELQREARPHQEAEEPQGVI